MSPETGAAVYNGLDRLHATMQPWASNGGYLNFAERPCDVDSILPPQTCACLREIKQRWDPDGMIRGNHTIVLAPA